MLESGQMVKGEILLQQLTFLFYDKHGKNLL